MDSYKTRRRLHGVKQSIVLMKKRGKGKETLPEAINDLCDDIGCAEATTPSPHTAQAWSF